MSLRTWKTRRELRAPVFSWCPFIQYPRLRGHDLSGIQENALGQVRTYVVRMGQVCYGSWENTYRHHLLSVSLQDRFLRMSAKRRRTSSGQVLTLVRGDQA